MEGSSFARMPQGSPLGTFCAGAPMLAWASIGVASTGKPLPAQAQGEVRPQGRLPGDAVGDAEGPAQGLGEAARSEEHTSELQSH